MEQDIRRRLGPIVWGVDDDTLESVVVDMMRERDVTIATMESCTGGLLASTLTDVAGCSGCFKGGLVSYATEMKIAWGVPVEVIEEHGVISAETAREMARVTRERHESSIGVGVTGVAGPDEQEGKPVGTVHVAVDAIWEAPRTVSYTFNQGRSAVKRRAVTTALGMLRQSLLSYRNEGLT
jgi:nicotinamide-nucleotide amidase